MSSSDKRNSGTKNTLFLESQATSEAENCYETLTKQRETTDNNYLEAACCP